MRQGLTERLHGLSVFLSQSYREDHIAFTSQTASEAGRKGGLTTVERHGRNHMRKIGRHGFHAMVKKVFDGDYRKAINYLINRGLIATDPTPHNRAWSTDRLIDWLPTDWNPPLPEPKEEL